jgi:hypothetical protein
MRIRSQPSHQFALPMGLFLDFGRSIWPGKLIIKDILDVEDAGTLLPLNERYGLKG